MSNYDELRRMAEESMSTRTHGYKLQAFGTPKTVISLLDDIKRLEDEKDGAYAERDKCVALIARLALDSGWPTGIGRHVGDDWDDDWRSIVFVELPTGQVSWHIHDSELPMFGFLTRYTGAWDGHDTPTKYARVLDAANAPQVEE